MDYTQQDIEDNMGLVHFVVQRVFHKMRDGLIGYDDMLGDGTLGLIHALEKFDPSRGFKFSSYGYKCIWGYIMRGNRDFYQERWKTRRPKTGNPEGTPAYTFSIHGKHSKDGNGAHNLTWEDVISDEDVVVGFYKEGDTTAEMDSLNAEWLRRQMMEPLNPRQRAVLEVILYNNLRQLEAAKQFGVSRQAVHIQWKKILRKIQAVVTPEILEAIA